MNKALAEVLRLGYAAQVMSKGTMSEAHAAFSKYAQQDAGFLKAAKDEMARCVRVADPRINSSGSSSAFLEQQHAIFLKGALEKAAVKTA